MFKCKVFHDKDIPTHHHIIVLWWANTKSNQCFHRYQEPCWLQRILQLLAGVWNKIHKANNMFKLVLQMFNWVEVWELGDQGNTQKSWSSYSSLQIFNISSRVTVFCFKIQLRKDNQHVLQKWFHTQISCKFLSHFISPQLTTCASCRLSWYNTPHKS